MSVDPSSPPIRPAATVMVVRDGPDPVAPLEVLMVRRNLRSDFVGGAYVFPGGGVDPGDRTPELWGRCAGRDDAVASALLGVDSGGLAYWVAALRECFEEAGLLLAYDPLGELLSLADPAVEGRFAHLRAELNAGRLGFGELCRRQGLRLATDRLHYFAHWITPEGAPRRYDTRFFVTAAPPDQSPAHDAAETVADVWIRPAEALRSHREGEIQLIFPTIRMLQAIGRFATCEGLLAAAESVAAVPTVLPRVVADGNGVRILLPGDPGYEQAGGIPPPRGQGAFDRAVRAVSQAANPAPGPSEERPEESEERGEEERSG